MSSPQLMDDKPGLFSAAFVRRLWTAQFLRFVAVGVLNTAFGYGLYFCGIMLGASYQLAVIVSTVLGAMFNFFTTGRLVFANDKWHRIFGFLGTYGVVLLTNLGLLTVLVEHGADKVLSQAALLPLIVILSFVLNKYLVFGSRS